MSNNDNFNNPNIYNNISFKNNKYIKIGTHNVRGFNVETKQRLMLDTNK